MADAADTDSSTTRDRVVEAAICLLADKGTRHLSHRRVDAQAGLPTGTTSNYFRTSAALFDATLQGLVQKEESLGARGNLDSDPVDAAGLVERLTGVVDQFLSDYEHLTAARYALMLEGRSNPTLNEAINKGAAELSSTLRHRIDQAQIPDPADAAQKIRIIIDGVLINSLLGADRQQLQRLLPLMLAQALHLTD